MSFVRGRSSTSITARRTCPCRCSHSIGSERNFCCPQSWRAAKFLMQISEHPTDLFAGPAAVDPVFLSQGDGFGRVVAVVAASRNLSLGRRRTFRESLLVGKFMVGSCQGACPVIPSLDTGLWLQQPFAAPPTPSVDPHLAAPARHCRGYRARGPGLPSIKGCSVNELGGTRAATFALSLSLRPSDAPLRGPGWPRPLPSWGLGWA